jgi:hypothetical protein
MAIEAARSQHDPAPERAPAPPSLDHAGRAARARTVAQERARACEHEASARAGAYREAAAVVGASVEQLRARLASLEADAASAEHGLRESYEQDVTAVGQTAAGEWR